MPIRLADPAADGAPCAAIYAPYVRDGAISFEEEAPTAEEMAGRIAAVSSTHPWLVEVDDGRVIGFAYASPHAARAAYRWAADVAVYVHPDHHRRGVGRRLYRELIARCHRQGFRILCAGITLPNDASVRLHTAMGFVPVGVYRRIGYKAGAWHDVGWWQRELSPGDHGTPPDPGPPSLDP